MMIDKWLSAVSDTMHTVTNDAEEIHLILSKHGSVSTQKFLLLFFQSLQPIPHGMISINPYMRAYKPEETMSENHQKMLPLNKKRLSQTFDNLFRSKHSQSI